MLAHLVSIRDLETFLVGKPFGKVKPKEAGAYRDRLVELVQLSKEDGGLSKSTVRHRISHLRAFFAWLRVQEGHRRLSGNIENFLILPRSVEANSLVETAKIYPTIEQAVKMLLAMPDKTLSDRRDRAMVACAFVTGFRAGALTSIRLKHLDVSAKTAVQDAREMRAKNGKSYRATWFPRTDAFQQVLVDWMRELSLLGFTPQDAVFPEVRDLVRRLPDGPTAEPMRTSSALQAAFERASVDSGAAFSPHSARHTLKALGDRLCNTSKARKAWSLNLGHANELITETHYGKMTDDQREQIIESLSGENVLAEDEKDIVLDYYENRFTRGTEDYRRARLLAEQREKARGEEDVVE